MRRGLWPGVAALLALAGCGVQPSGVIVGASPPSGAAAPGPATTLYFLSAGRPFPVLRAGPPLSYADTLAELAAGPTEEERARGLGTEVPPEAAPFTVTASGAGRVVVTLSMSPERLSTVATEQIACTAADRRGEVVLFGEGQGRSARCPR
ncbi:hypothetical protein [Prauserella flavalba]|uniref:GerMN domain-containing protein n=1 Tax=Prauserella flavalba TaxID=1477506 RepID=A0A318LCF0_9PSEU|nr:hypothetical protein [Prauserella flavalba]PXY17929.1 hypothetical protein BA062_36330 [Prauserella flavalba]